MKKSILFVFALIPLLASCNNNSNGFVNPFPDDEYHPVGLNFEETEKVSRPLTTSEQALLNSTYAENNDKYIKQHDITIQTRDYTRAFAGEFEQGYSASNTKKTEQVVTFRQDETTSSNNDAKDRRRTVTDIDSNAVYDYYYGRNTSHTEKHEWHYYAVKDPSDAEGEKYKEDENHAADKDGELILSQTKSSESTTSTAVKLASYTTDSSLNGWDVEPDEVFSNGLLHSEFLPKLSECSSTPGADKKDNIILVKVEQKKYVDPSGEAEEGIYSLPDGRTYQAMENSLTVSKLEIKKAVKTGVGATPWENDWYVVSYARRYTEISITSDVIQPNVPISALSKPIVIHYTEERHNFYTDTTKVSSDEIPSVVVEEDK